MRQIAFLAAVLAAIKEEAVLEAHGSTVVETETVEPIVVILDLKAAAVEALKKSRAGGDDSKGGYKRRYSSAPGSSRDDGW
jgi:hypothetical protein